MRRFFFFFQAEDGIRDTSVTGVQTCALPIWQRLGKLRALREREHGADHHVGHSELPVDQVTAIETRSEERRVGKECRSRWWRCDVKKRAIRARVYIMNDGARLDTTTIMNVQR